MSNIPKTYRAAFVEEKGGKFVVKEVEYKSPSEGQVTVKVLASGVCHSDSIVVEQHMPIPLPRCPGHECVGEVVEVAPGEKRWKVGDRVGAGWHGGHCFSCSSCLRGDFVTCEKENINGILTDGGHAEYATFRSESLASLPTDIDPAEAAPLLCAGVTTFNSLRNMDLHPGDVVAVQGIGGLGHLALQFSRQMGFKTIALSGSDSKKQLAQELGAHVYVDSSKEDPVEVLQKEGGAKVIVCTAPNPEIVQTLVNGLGVNGQLLILAVGGNIEVPMIALIQKRLSIRGWPSGNPIDEEDTVRFAQAAGVHCKVQKFKLDDIQQAYDAMMDGSARFRSVITF
ncbi:hypothetical protein JCM10213_002082 [Rhodosporidiobolus nylandii]